MPIETITNNNFTVRNISLVTEELGQLQALEEETTQQNVTGLNETYCRYSQLEIEKPKEIKISEDSFNIDGFEI